jgi:hypothetical protein
VVRERTIIALQYENGNSPTLSNRERLYSENHRHHIIRFLSLLINVHLDIGRAVRRRRLATEFLCWQKSEEKSLGRGRISLAGAFRFAWVSQSVVY